MFASDSKIASRKLINGIGKDIVGQQVAFTVEGSEQFRFGWLQKVIFRMDGELKLMFMGEVRELEKLEVRDKRF